MWPFRKKKKNLNKSNKRVLKVNQGKRNFDGGSSNNFLEDWKVFDYNIDQLVSAYYEKLKRRARNLSHNDCYIKRYLKILEIKILGPHGIKLNCDFKNEKLNEKIETAFKNWSKAKYCTVDGKSSLRKVLQFALKSFARDGECFIRIVYNFNNKYKFALQLLDPEQIDFNYNNDLPNGHKIRFGIEFDSWGKPVKYFLIDGYLDGKTTHTEIKTSEIIHFFETIEANQKRGFSQLATSIITMRHLYSLTEAELIASRVAAAKMGVITTQDGASYTGDKLDDDNNVVEELTPGSFTQLPIGSNVEFFDPKHPNGSYKDFSKVLLKKTASGLNVTYADMSGDLTEVNYSSQRTGELTARDYYRDIQEDIKEIILDRILEGWLKMTLLNKQVSISNIDLESFKYHWQARAWAWVDPSKDLKSQIDQNTAGLKSKKEIVEESGRDYNTVKAQIAKEKEENIKNFNQQNNIIDNQTNEQGKADEELENQDIN